MADERERESEVEEGAPMAAEERDASFEGFTTPQAFVLAFLVLLNIIVIGLGIWQVSRYFGWF
jgi:hypothetical protein